MPIYEYVCKKCEKHFEEFQSIKDNPLKTCKLCGGEATKVISQTSFALKGGGWYKDGYASPKKTGDLSSKTDSKKEDKTKAKDSTTKQAPSAPCPPKIERS